MKSLWEKEGVRGRDQKTQFQPKRDHCPIKLPTLLHFSNINSHLHRVAEHNSQSLLREGADFEALNNGQGQVSVLWLMSRPWTNTRNSTDRGEDGFQVHVIISCHLQAHARECFFGFYCLLQEVRITMWQSCSIISSCDCHAACMLHLFMCWTHLIWLQMKGQRARAHVCRQWCMYMPNSVQKKQSPPRPLYLFQQFLLNAYFMLARHVEGHSKMLFMRQMGNIPNVHWRDHTQHLSLATIGNSCVVLGPSRSSSAGASFIWLI